MTEVWPHTVMTLRSHQKNKVQGSGDQSDESNRASLDMLPRVSVVIAAYNPDTQIIRALMSVVGQTVKVFEVIVVDDQSTDRTLEYVERVREEHPMIRVISQSQNGGPSRARNVGIAAAKGDWIAVLDADDSWTRDRLERLMTPQIIASADLIADNQILYDREAMWPIREGFHASWSQWQITMQDLFENDLADRSPLGFGILKPIFRRSFLESHGLRYDESIRYGEDFAMMADFIAAGGRAILVNYAGYIYSVRHSPMSKGRAPGSQSVSRFDHLIEANDALAKKHAHLLNAESMRAVAARRDYFSDVHLSNVARAVRRNEGLMRYGMFLANHPRLVRMLASRTLGRLSRRKSTNGLQLSGRAGSSPDTMHLP